MLRSLVGPEPQRGAPRASLLSLLLLLIAIGLSGCNGTQKKEAQQLAKQGSETGESLALFYTKLAEQNSEFLRLNNAVIVGRVGNKPDPKFEKDLAQQQKALYSRAAMSRGVKGVYDALGRLVDYDAGEVSQAVLNLKKQILEVTDGPPLGFNVAGHEVTPEQVDEILGKVVRNLVEMQQVKQFRRKAPLAQKSLDGILEFFDTEKFIYDQIMIRSDQMHYQTATALLDARLAHIPSVFQPTVDRFGMELFGRGADYVQTQGVLVQGMEQLRALEDVKHPDNSDEHEARKEDARQRIKALRRHLDDLEGFFNAAKVKVEDDTIKAYQQSVQRADQQSEQLYALRKAHSALQRIKLERFYFQPADIQDVDRLAESLQKALVVREERKKNGQSAPNPLPVTEYLALALSPQTREMVQGGNFASRRQALAKALAQDLNAVLEADLAPRDEDGLLDQGEDLPTRPGLVMSERVQLLQSIVLAPRVRAKRSVVYPTGMMRVQFNRLLLEDTFSNVFHHNSTSQP